jgi:hypothetical protein
VLFFFAEKSFYFRCVNHHIITREDCLLLNGTFHYPSESREACLGSNYTYCWTSQTSITGLLTPRDSLTGRCPDGGTPQNLFRWEEAMWIGGTWAYAKWTTRQSIRVNNISNTINFPLLESYVSAPSEISLKTSFQNLVTKHLRFKVEQFKFLSLLRNLFSLLMSLL